MNLRPVVSSRESDYANALYRAVDLKFLRYTEDRRVCDEKCAAERTGKRVTSECLPLHLAVITFSLQRGGLPDGIGIILISCRPRGNSCTRRRLIFCA
jgi:hypothetical protein